MNLTDIFLFYDLLNANFSVHQNAVCVCVRVKNVTISNCIASLRAAVVIVNNGYNR